MDWATIVGLVGVPALLLVAVRWGYGVGRATLEDDIRARDERIASLTEEGERLRAKLVAEAKRHVSWARENAEDSAEVGRLVRAADGSDSALRRRVLDSAPAAGGGVGPPPGGESGPGDARGSAGVGATGDGANDA